jgi:hypothetical protein
VKGSRSTDSLTDRSNNNEMIIYDPCQHYSKKAEVIVWNAMKQGADVCDTLTSGPITPFCLTETETMQQPQNDLQQ